MRVSLCPHLLFVTVALVCIALEPGPAVGGESDGSVPECQELIDIQVPTNPRHADYVMKIQYSDRLVCLVRSDAVYRAFLSRVGLGRKFRREGLQGLATASGNSPMAQWIAAVRRLDTEGLQLDPRAGRREVSDAEWDAVLSDYTALLAELDRRSVFDSREALVALTTEAKKPQVRRLGYAALVNLDGELDGARNLAGTKDANNLVAAGRWMAPEKLRTELFLKGRYSIGAREEFDREFIRFLSYVPGHDSEVFGVLEANLNTPYQSRVLESLLARDSAKWPPESLEPLAEKLTRLYGALDQKARTRPDGKRLAKLISRVADHLGPGTAATIRARLAGLEVAEYRVVALREALAFDTDVLVLQAAQPTEITFINQDTMPHNLVVTEPGAMERVGIAADQMALLPASEGGQYVPGIPEVLFHSSMVGNGETAKLSFIAPNKTGVYPLLCTYPGHWLKMFAAIVVVPDRKAYLAANPTLPSREELLEIRSYDHDFNQLAVELAEAEGNHSFARGRAAFFSRACVSCHAIGGKGGRVGPELSTLAEKQSPRDILRSIMYPSEKIDPKFAKVEVEELESGKVFQGVLIPQDDPEVVYLVEDPLTECEPQVFSRNQVEIVPLKLSPMPDQLLRRSSPEEVLDLITFIYAGGSSEHPVYATGD
ncbi:MAG: plastocyanin/azurin family copper-binding protein [Pirellulales bacterium]|nr:plastocyanin/azurin family copper-binding protein [Pirellulales bacterium]